MPSERGSAGASWGIPLVLLLVVLPLLLWAEVSFDRRLGGSASLVELSKPRGYVDATLEKKLNDVSRLSIVEVAGLFVDPGNPLDLSPEERRAAQKHLVLLASLADQLLWQMHRMVGSASPETLREHRALLGDQTRVLRMQGARVDLLEGMLSGRYGAAAVQAAREAGAEKPEGWLPTADPQRQALWVQVFGDPNQDLPSDMFLPQQVRNLAVLQLEQRADPADLPTFLSSILAFMDLEVRMREEWMLLYRLFILPDRRRVQIAPIGPRRPDLSFDQMAEGLREAARRGAEP